MDYIAIIFFIAVVTFSGWFYSCKAHTWCGGHQEGITIDDALARAQKESDAKKAENAKKETEEKALEEKGDVQKKDGDEEKKEKITCKPFITKDIKPNAANDKREVIKLEKFLNTYEGEKLIVGGVYDGTDQAAVKRFQEKYRKDILEPYGVKRANGNVLKSTRAKINEIYCAKTKGKSAAKESKSTK